MMNFSEKDLDAFCSEFDLTPVFENMNKETDDRMENGYGTGGIRFINKKSGKTIKFSSVSNCGDHLTRIGAFVGHGNFYYVKQNLSKLGRQPYNSNAAQIYRSLHMIGVRSKEEIIDAAMALVFSDYRKMKMSLTRTLELPDAGSLEEFKLKLSAIGIKRTRKNRRRRKISVMNGQFELIRLKPGNAVVLVDDSRIEHTVSHVDMKQFGSETEARLWAEVAGVKIADETVTEFELT